MGVDSFVKKRVGSFRIPLEETYFDLHVSRRNYVSDTWFLCVSDTWFLCVSENVPIFSELDVTLLHVDFAWSLQVFDYLIN